MRKFLLSLLFTLLFFSNNIKTQAAVIGFDDCTTGEYATLGEYEGFIWGNMGIWNSFGSWYPNTGVEYGNVSPNYVALHNMHNTYNSYVRSHTGTYFDYTGGYYTLAYYDSKPIKLVGSKDGEEKYTQIINIVNNKPTPIVSNFYNIDKVDFILAGDYLDYIIIDDFTVNEPFTPTPVPEPSSIILGLLGFSGAAGLGRKKK